MLFFLFAFLTKSIDDPTYKSGNTLTVDQFLVAILSNGKNLTEYCSQTDYIEHYRGGSGNTIQVCQRIIDRIKNHENFLDFTKEFGLLEDDVSSRFLFTEARNNSENIGKYSLSLPLETPLRYLNFHYTFSYNYTCQDLPGGASEMCEVNSTVHFFDIAPVGFIKDKFSFKYINVLIGQVLLNLRGHPKPFYISLDFNWDMNLQRYYNNVEIPKD